MSVNAAAQTGVERGRIVASGALWSVVYNLTWGLAWFGFMRREWADATAAVGRPMPWTAEVWFVWIVLTVPLGVAVMAHVASRGMAPWKAVVPSLIVCLPFAAGMVVWGVQESLALRVLVLDGLVNLVGLVLASIIGAWSLGSRAAPG